MLFNLTLARLIRCFYGIYISAANAPVPPVNADVPEKNTNKCVDYIFVSFIFMEARSGQNNLFLLLVFYSFRFTTGIIFICGLN